MLLGFIPLKYKLCFMVTMVSFTVYNISDELSYDNLFNEHLCISYA